MGMCDDIFEEALLKRARWIEGHMRQLDPRELCHVTLVEFRHRPMYWELHCRGRNLGAFEIATRLPKESA